MKLLLAVFTIAGLYYLLGSSDYLTRTSVGAIFGQAVTLFRISFAIGVILTFKILIAGK
jgi:hypothetical protein